jgi:hypothetical protein
MVQAALGGLTRGYVQVTVWLVLAVTPLMLARFAANLVASQAVVLAMVILVTWTLLLYLALFPTWSEKRRQALLSRLRDGGGGAAPIVYGVAIVGIAVIFFASFSWLLADREWLRFGDAGHRLHVAEPSEFADFFLWQTFEAVPGLKINDTLRWKQPLPYEDGWVGVVVLAFKITVLVPAVAMMSTAWRNRGRRAEEGDQSPEEGDKSVALLPNWFPRRPIVLDKLVALVRRRFPRPNRP